MIFAAAVVAFLYFLLPKLAGFDETWSRFKQGDPLWLAVALALELASFGGYVLLFRGVVSRDAPQLGWRESYQITMAGLAATRLFAAGGAGGIALTAWALRRSGMGPRRVAGRISTFMVALYSVYAAALVVDGLLLRTGVLNGPNPFALTIVPAIFGGTAILIVLASALVPGDLGRRWQRGVRGPRWVGTVVKWIGRVPATFGVGVRSAIRMLLRRDLHLLGALAWWGFDIAVLWACFHAFGGDPPPWAVLVMAYFVGMLANTLPLPGGIGGVEGGMIGALIAFDVPGGLAVVSVLAYRVFSFWLPTVPGAIAYLGLRRKVREWREEGLAPDAEPLTSGA
jgi:putative heme transporter